MKLYYPEAADKFVFAVTGKSDREGSAPKYMAGHGPDIESALNDLVKQGWKPAAPHCMGRYDDFGRYCTYKPPVDGIAPGKFVMHPAAQDEYIASRTY